MRQRGMGERAGVEVGDAVHRGAERPNLNHLHVDVHHGGDGDGAPERVFGHLSGARARGGKVEVHFRDLERELVALIDGAQAVFGCVAWLTSEPVLAALAHKRYVAIVVQKEDFLRPDASTGPGWESHLRQLYESLRFDSCRFNLDNPVGALSTFGDPNLPAVRCMGVCGEDRRAVQPRMHHKFLVMADASMRRTKYQETLSVRPHTVWTGSYNPTRNAALSLENAIVCRDRAIVAAYYEEWQRVEALSEPLDWESRWAEPEWRIGT